MADIVITVGITATLMAVSVPAAINMVDSSRLNMSVRDVERELQFARLKAVATNRPMRVRFDCPAAGQFRAVELIGTPPLPDASDDVLLLARCSEVTYPYRPTGADQSRLTRPNNDGPVRRLQQGATFSAKPTLEFWANGEVHFPSTVANQAGPLVGDPGATITLTRKGISKGLKVSSFGKIQMDR